MFKIVFYTIMLRKRQGLKFVRNNYIKILLHHKNNGYNFFFNF